jgi:hypothetical protein
MGTFRRFLGIFLIGLMLAGFVGCSKVSQANYDKISNGMTISEVKAILGEPNDSGSVEGGIGDVTASATKMVWGNDSKSITVTFVNDKVTAKSAQGL